MPYVWSLVVAQVGGAAVPAAQKRRAQCQSRQLWHPAWHDWGSMRRSGMRCCCRRRHRCCCCLALPLLNACSCCAATIFQTGDGASGEESPPERELPLPAHLSNCRAASHSLFQRSSSSPPQVGCEACLEVCAYRAPLLCSQTAVFLVCICASVLAQLACLSSCPIIHLPAHPSQRHPTHPLLCSGARASPGGAAVPNL